jgi:hypothetical protein
MLLHPRTKAYPPMLKNPLAKSTGPWFSIAHKSRQNSFPAHRWQGRWCHSKKRRKRTKFKENTIEIFQWKKEKKISVAGFYTDENGREVVRW